MYNSAILWVNKHIVSDRWLLWKRRWKADGRQTHVFPIVWGSHTLIRSWIALQFKWTTSTFFPPLCNLPEWSEKTQLQGGILGKDLLTRSDESTGTSFASSHVCLPWTAWTRQVTFWGWSWWFSYCPIHNDIILQLSEVAESYFSHQ